MPLKIKKATPSEQPDSSLEPASDEEISEIVDTISRKMIE